MQASEFQRYIYIVYVFTETIKHYIPNFMIIYQFGKIPYNTNANKNECFNISPCNHSVMYSAEMRGGVVIMSKQLSYYYGITILKRPRLFDVAPGL